MLDRNEAVGHAKRRDAGFCRGHRLGNRIERRYREDGFVATRVIIPPQAIKDGVPTLEVFEGKIIHYEINGERTRDAALTCR